MCMELKYRNSKNEFMVDFAYLAIDENMIINKILDDNTSDDFTLYDNQLWFQIKGDFNTLTALISYEDEENYDISLRKDLVDMSNQGFIAEVIDNIIDMFVDALIITGLKDGLINKLISEIFNNENNHYTYRTIDFTMHLPSEDYIHPGYDT